MLKHWDTFAVKENDKYSVILISDAENSPQRITRYYEPDLDKTAYATRLIEKTEYAYIVEYINKHGKQLILLNAQDHRWKMHRSERRRHRFLRKKSSWGIQVQCIVFPKRYGISYVG